MVAFFSPLVVAGMHRSGTSMVAAWAAALGVHMGERTVPADSANPQGYFEDVDFLDLNRRMLAACVRTNGDGGHPDWGWTESEEFDGRGLPQFGEEARALISRRSANRRPWGWKDPRTSLLLDFWDGVEPQSGIRYLLLYRFPWDVADSMQRLGADVFLRHPDYAYRIWTFYNRRLLEFQERHEDRSILLSVDALRLEPDRFPGLLRERLGLDLRASEFKERPARNQFRTVCGDDPLCGLVALARPECIRLLEELDRRAALPSDGLWRVPPRGPARKGQGSEDGVDLSVVIPCYNQGELLLEAVASAERSVRDRWELIIVNDGSHQPRTLEILAILRSAGYEVHDQEHLGLSAARNAGIRLARGQFILPLDDDNRVHPWFVEEAVRILSATPGVDIVYGDRYEFGKRTGQIDVPDFDLDLLLSGNYIDACAVYRKEVWEACGGYDTSLRAWEDWEFWIASAQRNRGFHHLPGVAFDYRVRPDSLVTICDWEDVAAALYEHIVSKHRGLYARRLSRVMAERSALSAECARHAAEVHRVMAERDSFRDSCEQLSRAKAILAAERDELGVERDVLAMERDVLAADRDALAAERDRLREEGASLASQYEALRAARDELAAGIEVLQQHVAFMKGTRAWRVRSLLLRLREFLEGVFGAGA